jgi:hypothetical protein
MIQSGSAIRERARGDHRAADGRDRDRGSEDDERGEHQIARPAPALAGLDVFEAVRHGCCSFCATAVSRERFHMLLLSQLWFVCFEIVANHFKLGRPVASIVAAQTLSQLTER